jgi:hypothetical protein
VVGGDIGLSASPAFASSNGYLTASELTLVQWPDTYLGNGTANSWLAMKAAAMSRDGVFMRISPAYRGAGGYRSYAVQVDMQSPGNWPLYDVIYPPAAPGHSTHGLGTTADVDLAPARAWILSHGAEFGWSFPIPSDSVHFLHDGVTAIGSTNPPLEEIGINRNMQSIRDPRNQRWWAVGNGDPQPFGDNELVGGVYVNAAVNAFGLAWGPGNSSLTTQQFQDAILFSTPTDSPIRPAIALAATPAQRATAAESIMAAAIVNSTT